MKIHPFNPVAAEVTRFIPSRAAKCGMRYEIRAFSRRLLRVLGALVFVGVLCPKDAKGEIFYATSEKPSTSLTASFVSPAIISSTIRPIINPSNTMAERLKAVHRLGETLGRDEISALYDFLKSAPAQEEKDIAGLHGLKNDTLNVLRNQSSAPEHLTDTLIKIYRDPTQDSVMRDYSIQHLVTWYEQGAPDSSQAKEKIRSVLHQAAQEDSSIAGTALLGMHRLSSSDDAFSGEEIDRMALHQTQSPGVNRATRITAIQVCAERGVKAVTPAIESLTQTLDSLPLRLSAIAALGKLGREENSPQMRPPETGSEKELSAALQNAVRQLK